MHSPGALRNSVRLRSGTKKRDQIERHESKLLKQKKTTALYLNPLQSTDRVLTLTTANLPLKTPTQKRKPVGVRRVRFGGTTICEPTSASEGSGSKDLNLCEQFLAFVPKHQSDRDTNLPSQRQDVIVPPSPRQAVPGDASLSVYDDRLDQVQMPPNKPYAEFHFQYNPTTDTTRAADYNFIKFRHGTMTPAYLDLPELASPSAHDGRIPEFVEF